MSLKGSAPKPQAPPPPVRESNQQTDAASASERKKAMQRRGYDSTVKPQSLIQPQGMGSTGQPGTRSLLG